MMKSILIYSSLVMAGVACQQNNKVADAYGNFETTEVTVSAEIAGKIQSLQVTEGQTLQQGQYVGLIDTTQLYLKKQQLQAQARTIQSRSPGVTSQVAVLLEQKSNAEKELKRFQALAQEGAATQKQVDDLQAQVAVLERQIQSARTQQDPLVSEQQMIQTQIAQVEEQLQDAKIQAPITGRVLLKIAEPGEMATIGTPLFQMASLDTLQLKVYISGSQLAQVKLGQEAEVLIDSSADAYKKLRGIVTWISDQAEFTPKVIQTKEERVDLVYAVKVRVPNDGSLKIGMPGEVNFLDREESLANHP